MKAVRMWVKKHLLIVAGLLPALVGCNPPGSSVTLAINKDYAHALVQCGILPKVADPKSITLNASGAAIDTGISGIQTGAPNECSFLIISKIHSNGQQ